MAFFLHPLTPLIAYSIGLSLVQAIAHKQAYEFEGTELLVRFGWTFALLCWFEMDARGRRILPCYDFGYLCYVCLPVSLAWYCLWSRGFRGILLLLLLCFVIGLPQTIGTIIDTFP
jgi:hypothetical protein